MAKKKIFILVEGPTDKRILVDFVLQHYLTDTEKPEKKGEMTLENDVYKVVIKQCKNGCGSIKEEETQADLQQKNDEGYQCVVILDADSEEKDAKSGGFQKRNMTIRQIKTAKNLNFELFLSPDNQSDGDLEDILMKSIPAEKQNGFNCIENYCVCLEDCLPTENKENIPNAKDIIRSMYPNIFDKKEPLFDLGSKAFSSLKAFLDTIF